MATFDDLDPLGNDWKARGERGTAVLREMAIEEAAGKQIPVDSLTRILADLAGSVGGTLQSIIDQARGMGLPDDICAMVGLVIADAQLQISVALDGAADEALGAIDTLETQIEALAETAAPDVRGPKERRVDTHKGKPTTGNAKPKSVRR